MQNEQPPHPHLKQWNLKVPQCNVPRIQVVARTTEQQPRKSNLLVKRTVAPSMTPLGKHLPPPLQGQQSRLFGHQLSQVHITSSNETGKRLKFSMGNTKAFSLFPTVPMRGGFASICTGGKPAI